MLGQGSALTASLVRHGDAPNASSLPLLETPFNLCFLDCVGSWVSRASIQGGMGLTERGPAEHVQKPGEEAIVGQGQAGACQ